jgi:hypothetical protein
MGKLPGLVVLYRWRIHEGKEEDFIRAWSKITEALLQKGSFGSRLHKGPDDIWYGYAQWPSDEARLNAFSEHSDPESARMMRESIIERLPEIPLVCVADYLVLPS